MIAIFGPTGVGKTAVAVALADLLREEGEEPVAVSVDAMAVYAGLDTLTGAPTAAEQSRLEHRLVSFLPVTETYSAGDHARRAHAEIDGLLAAGRRPIVVGGTGLYLRAALSDLDLAPPAPSAVRARWHAALTAEGPQALHRRLASRAPWAAADIAPGDGRRIVRALELAEIGALRGPGDESRLWTAAPRHPTFLAGLVMDRDALTDRIDARVEAMVTAGAGDEVRAADAAGASHTARKALGFAELLADDLDTMKANTRRFAKRQLTWMRKLAGIDLVDVTDRTPADVAGELLTRVQAHGST